MYSWFPFLFYEPLKMEQQCSARGLYHHKKRLDLAQTQWCADPQFQRVSATQSWVEKQGTCFQLSDESDFRMSNTVTVVLTLYCTTETC